MPLTDGKNAQLVWDATETVDPDGTVQIKADFTGPNVLPPPAPRRSSVVVDRNCRRSRRAPRSVPAR